MAIKKVLLSKKINDVVYDIFPKTSADIVTYGESTVAAALASFATDLSNVYTKTEADAAIKTSADNLYNKIMGITDTDGTTVDEAYDTLKEVAAWIDKHGDVAAAFTTDIAALKTAVGSAPTDDNAGSGLLKAMKGAQDAIASNDDDISDLQTKVTALETAVGDANSGLTKTVATHTTQIAAIETAIGTEPTTDDAGSGILKRIADLENVGSTKVEKSKTNGNIKIDGVETVVYTHPATHDATMITTDASHRFVTDDQLDIINKSAAVTVVTDQASVTDANDLYLVEISA